MKIHPVILVGGAGSRFWPLSRERHPKPFLPLACGPNSLFQKTLQRLQGLSASNPIVVCNEAHRFLAMEQLTLAGQTPEVVLLEPLRRNTAPALTLSVLWLLAREQDALLLILPSDHLIESNSVFHDAVAAGIPLAQQGQLVAFGVVPSSPHTGYGYIQRGQGSQVAAFVEKPGSETAKQYLQSGEWFWNSGMFLMKASAWSDELQCHQPSVWQACQHAFHEGHHEEGFYFIGHEPFKCCPSISIDYAVMEKTKRAAMVPLATGWSDIGDWASFHANADQDERHNVVQGDVLCQDTQDSVLIAQQRLLVAVGLKSIIAVETPDAVLVTTKEKAQDVKKIVEQLQQLQRPEAHSHRRVHKPWGSYEVLDSGPGFQVKRITVNAGASLSLQSHQQRAEHWIVVHGTAKVTKDHETITLDANQSTYIPAETKHRLENVEQDTLDIIEVQVGDYLGEDDIVRYEDRYHRLNDRSGT